MKSKAFLEPGNPVPDMELTVNESDYNMSNPIDSMKYSIAKFINTVASLARKLIDYGG